MFNESNVVLVLKCLQVTLKSLNVTVSKLVIAELTRKLTFAVPVVHIEAVIILLHAFKVGTLLLIDFV